MTDETIIYWREYEERKRKAQLKALIATSIFSFLIIALPVIALGLTG